MTKQDSIGKKQGLAGIGTCFYSRAKGWPGSGFEWKDTEITVDRIPYEGRDELRLNITIRTATGKRVREEHGWITLPDGYAIEFVKVASTPRKSKAA